MRAVRRRTKANMSAWLPTVPACAIPHPPTSTCEVGNAVSRSKAGTRPVLFPLPPWAHSLRAPLFPADPSRRAPHPLVTAGPWVRRHPSLDLSFFTSKMGAAYTPRPHACDRYPVGCRTWWGGRRERGRAKGVSLGPTGLGEPAGHCPARPPARPSESASVVCRAVPPLAVCLLCFSKLRGLS